MGSETQTRRADRLVWLPCVSQHSPTVALHMTGYAPGGSAGSSAATSAKHPVGLCEQLEADLLHDIMLIATAWIRVDQISPGLPNGIHVASEAASLVCPVHIISFCPGREYCSTG
jgi:hypothetical protein